MQKKRVNTLIVIKGYWSTRNAKLNTYLDINLWQIAQVEESIECSLI